MRAVNVSTGERSTLKPLTSLRFVAALLVFACHFPPTRAFAVTYRLGEAGVCFFFVLSGFILTYTYQHDFAGRFSARAAWSFHRARVARIYPVHLAAMALCLAWFIPFGAPEWNITDPIGRIATTVAQVLLLQSWLSNPGFYAGVNAVSWSVSVEAFFYGLFPFALWLTLALLRNAPWWKALGVAVALWLLQLGSLAALSPTANSAWMLYQFPPSRLLDFVVGMLMAITFLRRPIVSPAYQTLVEVGVIACVTSAILAIPYLPEALQYATALMPFWAGLIYAFAIRAGTISNLASRPWFVHLGEVSYAFYMVHYVVLIAEDHLLGWRNPALSLCIGFAVTLAMSFALFHWIEAPMRRWIRGASIIPTKTGSNAFSIGTSRVQPDLSVHRAAARPQAAAANRVDGS